MTKDIVKQANHAVEHSSLAHLMLIDGQNVADQHVFEVFGFASRFAHGQNGRSGGHGIGNADKGFLRNVAAPGACEGKNGGAHKGEGQTQPVGAASVCIHSNQNGDRCPQGSNLSQGQVNENHAAFHHMHAQISVYSVLGGDRRRGRVAARPSGRGAAFGRAGKASAEVTWDRAIGRLLS